MKAIVYSLFNDCAYPFEFDFYRRGIAYNVRMNKILYPEWVTVIYYDETLPDWVRNDINELNAIKIPFKFKSRCDAMLQRIRYAWDNPACTHLLCRDADAITTRREVTEVNQWLQFKQKPVMSIIDNTAHGYSVMGGMCGFDCNYLRSNYDFNELTNCDLSTHGTDQTNVLSRFNPDCEFRNITGSKWQDESDLTCRHVGSAGVVEMELLRFFQRHDSQNNHLYE